MYVFFFKKNITRFHCNTLLRFSGVVKLYYTYKSNRRNTRLFVEFSRNIVTVALYCVSFKCEWIDQKIPGRLGTRAGRASKINRLHVTYVVYVVSLDHNICFCRFSITFLVLMKPMVFVYLPCLAIV